MYVVIHGGGAVGSYLARSLHGQGHHVAIIEGRTRIVDKLAEELSTDVLVIQGDGCDVHYQQDAGVDRADVFAAVTRHDEVNLISCRIAKEKYSVRRAVARVNGPRAERVFHALGIEAISSTTVIGRLIEEEMTVGDIIRLSVLQKGELALVEMEVPGDTAAPSGRSVAELGLPEDVVLVSVARGGAIILPRGGTVLLPGDRVMAVTAAGGQERLARALRGQAGSGRP